MSYIYRFFDVITAGFVAAHFVCGDFIVFAVLSNGCCENEQKFMYISA